MVDTRRDFPTLVNAMISRQLDTLWTCVPAIIISVDYTHHTCSIRPKAKSSQSELPILEDVPIAVMAMGDGSMIITALKKGDVVLVLFSKYALTELMKDRNTAIPDVPRAFDINDAIVVAGLFMTIDKVPAYSSGDLLIHHKSGAHIKIDALGNIEIKGRTINFVQYPIPEE